MLSPVNDQVEPFSITTVVFPVELIAPSNVVPFNVKSKELIESTIKPMFSKYGILIIVLTAVTPIPYKLLAIWLGFIGYPILLFLGVSAIFRTGRFAIIGALLYYFQERANTIVKKYFWPLTIGAVIAAVLGISLISLF